MNVELETSFNERIFTHMIKHSNGEYENVT